MTTPTETPTPPLKRYVAAIDRDGYIVTDEHPAGSLTDYLVAKDRIESLERQLSDANAQIAELEGVVHEIAFFAGCTTGAPTIVKNIQAVLMNRTEEGVPVRPKTYEKQIAQLTAQLEEARRALERVRGMCEYEGKPIKEGGVAAVWQSANSALAAMQQKETR